MNVMGHRDKKPKNDDGNSLKREPVHKCTESTQQRNNGNQPLALPPIEMTAAITPPGMAPSQIAEDHASD